MPINERFSESGQKAMSNAQREAINLKRGYMGTEHLLLGCLHDPGKARDVLKGITPDVARNEIIELIGRGSDGVAPQRVLYTPRTRKVIEQSQKEANALGEEEISVEHIILALMREREAVAAHVLIRLGVDLDRAREELLKVLSVSAQTEDGKAATPMLEKYARNLTAAAANGELDPLVGRQNEIERIEQILSRRTKNNPVLVGEPGVGKSAIVEGLAQKIVIDAVPETLRGCRLMSLDLAGLIAGTKFRGEFEERLKTVMDEIKSSNDIILFIDELHTLIGAGAAEGSMDASNMLKPMLARGEIRCIGATTLNEYHKRIEKDPALERRFQSVMVNEPTKEQAVDILKGLRVKYEEHHHVEITDEAVEAAVNFSDRYISDRCLPDKAIDLVDEACARARLMDFAPPPDTSELQKDIDALGSETELAIAEEDFERAANLRDRRNQLISEIDDSRKAWEEENRSRRRSIGEEDIAHIVSMWTGVPVSRMTEIEADRLVRLEETLHKRVIGQDEAVTAVARAVRRARVGIKDPNRPIGSFIFLGPTGVGKTELCKALGEALFGDEDSVIRMDMSEYMEKHTVSRMIGSPPGYVGYDEGGQLTEKVKRKPYSIVLFDEVEKAHPDVFNILLQIMEDGRLTDGQGRVVDFKNTVIVMTSNVGAHELRKQRSMGFGESEGSADYESMRDNVMEVVKRTFRPEFLNRVDEIIVFHALEDEQIKQIALLMTATLSKRLSENGIELVIDDSALSKLSEEGYDLQYGARPLRRAIQKQLEDELSDELLLGRIKSGDRVKAHVSGGRIVFSVMEKETPLLEEAEFTVQQ